MPVCDSYFNVSKKSFRPRRRFAFHRRPSRFPCALPPKTGGATGRKNLFSPLPLFSELVKVLKIFDFNGAGKPAKRRRWRIKRACFEEGFQTSDTQDSLFGLSRRCIPSWVISALRAALRRLRSETLLRAQSRTPPSPARGMQHPQRDRAADGCPTLYKQFLKGQQLLSCAKRAAATRISLFAYLWQLLFVQSYLTVIVYTGRSSQTAGHFLTPPD